MALEEKSFIDEVSWRSEVAIIEVRRSSVVLRDGVEIAREYHRHTVLPDDSLEEEDPQVRVIAEAFQKERAARVEHLKTNKPEVFR